MATPQHKDEDRRKRRRVAQILALGLIWAVGVLALVVGSASSKRRAPAAPPAAAAPHAAVAASDVVADTGRDRHHACKLQAVSFPTRDEGWVTDACGRAFHTTDGGVSFETVPMGDDSLALMEGDVVGNLLVGEVTRMEWLSDQRGVAFANDVRSERTLVMTTSDGGATWQRRRLPVSSSEMYYASDHAGDTVWVCGATGAIMRSRDGGAHFARTRHTPFNHDDRCMALSFIDADSGWAGGMDGTLYETRDGGDSWKRMAPPRKARPTGATTTSDAPVYDLRVSGVLRLRRGLGWVSMEQENPEAGAWTYVTGDDGRTWEETPAPPLIEARLARGSQWGDSAVIARDQRLAFYSGATLVRETPLLSAATGVREVIRGRETLNRGGHLAGWTDHAIIESYDDARSWWTVARVGDGQRIRRVVHPGLPTGGSRPALVELAGGGIRTGWTWLQASTQPEFDRFVLDMTDAHRLGTPVPEGPLSCLATAPTGSIDLRFGTSGCREYERSSFRIAWTPDKSTMQSVLRPARDGGASLALPAAARVKLLGAIADAVQRPDDGGHNCTSKVYARLEWRCGAAAPQHVSFKEASCAQYGGPPDVGPAHRVEQLVQKTIFSLAH